MEDYATLNLRIKYDEVGKAEQQMISFESAAKKAVAAAGAFLAGGKLLSFGGSSSKAWSEQENAINKMSSALRNAGSEVYYNTKRFEEFSSKMQDKTVFGDETVLGAMAYAKNLGVVTSEIERATTAAIGLSGKYEMDLPAAMQLVGRASQGHTEMLARYGITLDDTMTKEEKYQELLKIGAASFGLAGDEIITFDGQIKQLNNNFGDFQEIIGRGVQKDLKALIAPANAVVKALNKMDDETASLIVRTTALAAAFGAIKAASAGMTLATSAYNSVVAKSASAMAADTAATAANTAAHQANAMARGGGSLAGSWEWRRGAGMLPEKEVKLGSRSLESSTAMLELSEKGFRRNEIMGNWSASRRSNYMQTFDGNIYRQNPDRYSNALSKLTKTGDFSSMKAFEAIPKMSGGLFGLNDSLTKLGKTFPMLNELTGLATSKLSSFTSVAGMAGVAFAGAQTALLGFAAGGKIAEFFDIGGAGALKKAQEKSVEDDKEYAKKLADIQKQREERDRVAAVDKEQAKELKKAQESLKDASFDYILAGIMPEDYDKQLGMLRGKAKDLEWQFTGMLVKTHEDAMKRLEIEEKLLAVGGQIQGVERQKADQTKKEWEARQEDQTRQEEAYRDQAEDLQKSLRSNVFQKSLSNKGTDQQLKMLTKERDRIFNEALGISGDGIGSLKKKLDLISQSDSLNEKIQDLSKPQPTMLSMVSDAVEAGSLEALKLRYTVPVNQNKVEENTGKSAEYLKNSIEVQKKIFDKLNAGSGSTLTLVTAV